MKNEIERKRMRMKLELIVTHYKEPWEVCKPLFDSIKLQQCIDFSQLGICIVNDGDDVIEQRHLVDMPCEVRYVTLPKGNVSIARNAGLKSSKADFVQFCDCDDMFLSSMSLYTTFQHLTPNVEIFWPVFVETQEEEGKAPIVITHNEDVTHLHGKVFSRQFLSGNDISFDENLYIHEDGFFTSLAMNVATQVDRSPMATFIWKWNDNSVVRKNHDRLYTIKTYGHLIAARRSLCRELFDRGMYAEGTVAVSKTIADAFYDYSKPDFIDQANSGIVAEAMKSVAEFIKDYAKYFREANPLTVQEALDKCRHRSVTEGMIKERMTIDEFLTVFGG